jgi:hypothetical protein
LLTVTVGNANVGVAVCAAVGDNTIAGVSVAGGVNVFVGVKVAAGVSVNVSAVAVTVVGVGAAGSSVEGTQAETNKKIIRAIRTIFN